MYNYPTVIYNNPTVMYNIPTVMHNIPSVLYNIPTVMYNNPTVMHNIPTVLYSKETEYKLMHSFLFLSKILINSSLSQMTEAPPPQDEDHTVFLIFKLLFLAI